MCRVLNKHAAGKHDGAIYIGRGSKWGNPFRISVDGDRATVIAKHARWLRDQHHLLRALDELRGKDLLCFCAPAALRERLRPEGRGSMPACHETVGWTTVTGTA
jgi:hypothetical protein